MATLDHLAIELQKDSRAEIYLVQYGPQGKDGTPVPNLLKNSEDYLVNNRGVARHVTRVYAGRYKNPKETLTQIWILDADDQPPRILNYDPNLDGLKGKFAEYQEIDGPYGCNGGDCDKVTTLAAFADVLGELKDTLGYIVAYNQKGASIGTWRRVAKQEAGYVEELGIPAERIKIIFGGTRKVPDDDWVQQATVQLWILPKDSPAPVKEARPERIPTKAVQVGVHRDWDVKNALYEKFAFDGFADVLKANKRLGVCIIVRPPLVPGYVHPDFPVEPGEPLTIDLNKLIEKWTGDLTKKYQIDNHRIFVITAAATEENDGTIETWIIPPGAAMPDPYATEPEESPNDKPMEF